MEKRRVLLTHYDLDGVASYILMKKMIQPIEKRICCGYGKVKHKVENGEMSGYDSCIVTDISLDVDQFEKLSGEYGDSMLYIDHHKTTKDALTYNNNSTVHFDPNFSATGIIFREYAKYLKSHKDIAKFVFAVDSYDMWRFQTHPDMFNIGYDLNILFWKYKFDGFDDRFSNNLSTAFSSDENKWIKEFKDKRDDRINNADITEFGMNSVLILDADQEYVNDFSLQLTQYDVFYIVYISVEGRVRVSIRSLLDPNKVDIGRIIKEYNGTNINIVSAGGHEQAGGIDFQEGVGIDVIIDIIEDVNCKVETSLYANSDVPF